MSTIALPHTTSKLPAKAKVAAGLALPLGLMGTLGTVIFFELSWLIWVSLWSLAQSSATLAGATLTLRDKTSGPALLRGAALSNVAFTAMKLAVWQETAAIPFGVAAVVIYLLLRQRNA